MKSLSQMKVTARKLTQAVESCDHMGWADTKVFYQSRLDKLNREIEDYKTFLANSAKTRGLPLPKSTF